MKKNNAFRRAAALMAALSITVSLAAPAFAGTYYIDDGDITIIKNENGSQTIKQQGKEDCTDQVGDETIITTHKKAITSLESDLEGPAAEDSGFGPVVEDNYQPAPPAQPEDAEEPKDADQPESTEEPEGTDQPKDAEEPKDADQPENTDRKESDEAQKDADQPENTDRQESAGQQPQPQQAAPADAPAAPAPGFCGNIITVINNFANKALKLTLKDVKIDVSGTGKYDRWGNSEKGKAALSVQGKGNVEIELDGKNELKSGVYRAGLEKTSTGTLTLKDDKKDDNKEAGSLKATGGQFGAGIGGGDHGSGKNITITGGTVTARGGKHGAGIGGGDHGSGEAITINGGTVTARGGEWAAGIGGGGDGNGNGGSGENITITGGTVNASGCAGAGIGGGNGGDGKNITITGGTVNADSNGWGAGIGGGQEGGGEDITITGGTVTATGGQFGAGIGGGGWGSGQNITITGGTVNASGCAGAGIGGGIDGSGSNVTVSGAAQVTVTASKGSAWVSADTGATIGNGGSVTEDNDLVDGKEIQADISGVTTGYIHHIIYNLDGTIKREWWEPVRTQPTPEDPNAPAEESNEVDLGTPVLHVETLEGVLLPFDAQQQGSTLRVTSNDLAARLHGTRQALEALREQGGGGADPVCHQLQNDHPAGGRAAGRGGQLVCSGAQRPWEPAAERSSGREPEVPDALKKYRPLTGAALGNHPGRPLFVI